MTASKPFRRSVMLPALHSVACLVGFSGLLVPAPSTLGIIFASVLMADLPVSAVSYMVAWKYPTAAAAWIFRSRNGIGGTLLDQALSF